METKICKTCLIEKTIENFRKLGKYIRNDCKDCENEKCKKRNKKNKEHIKIKQKEYRNINKEKIKKYRKEHYNSIKQKEYNKKYYTENKNYYSCYHKKYVKLNKEQIILNQTKWRNNNRNKYREYQKKDFQRRMNDPILKLELQLRNLVNNSFKKKGEKKSHKLELICGINSKELVKYLIQTFKNNYGVEWDGIEPVHIDHIMPLATVKSEEDVIKLCHYTNLQLLKAKDNLQKGSKLNWQIL